MMVSPKVSHETVDGEVIVIDLQTGSYYSLPGTANPVWEMISAAWSREEIVERATAVWGAAAVPVVGAFLDELLAEGLVREGESVRQPVTVEFPAEFSPPRFEKFTDLQELLLIDPIHEVDASGWPHKRAS